MDENNKNISEDKGNSLKKVAAAIASFATVVKATSVDVNANCSCGDCTRICRFSCSYNCTGSCDSGCSGRCRARCADNCTATCASSCNARCGSGCASSCSGGCQGGCNTTCNNTCNDTCRGSCNNTCNDTCTGSCNNTCTGSCTSSCSQGCNGCTGYCQGCAYGCSYGCQASEYAYYTITLDNKGASYAGTSSVSNQNPDSTMRNITPPRKNGYTFEGYEYEDADGNKIQYYDANGKGVRNWDNVNSVSARGTSSTAHSTAKLNAMWKPISYSINYETHGGKFRNDVISHKRSDSNPSLKGMAKKVTSYNIESEDIVLESPTRKGTEFKGWKRK